MNPARPRHKRLLKLRAPRARSKASNYMLSDNHKFDEATGQVYTETTASIQSTDDRDWTRRTLGPGWRDSEDELQLKMSSRSQESLKDYREYLHSVKSPKARRFKGVRSLQATSFESVLQHISDVTLEGLECLPIQVVRRLWHAMNRRCILSFDTWTIFSKLLHKDEEATLDLLRYRQEIKKPISPLQVYTAPLTSASFDFMSSLSITIPLPLQDLAKICTIKNLGTLEILNPATGSLSHESAASSVTDRLIRTWHHAAVEDEAFRVLRILRLWGHPEITQQSMVYLNSFPALAIYDVRWCGFVLSASTVKNHEWKPILEPNILGLLDSVCAERVALMRSNLGIEGTPNQKAFSPRLKDRSRLRRIPRSEVLGYLAQSRPPFPEEASDKSDKHTSSKGTATWESTINAIFSRIGELRNDTDLKKAGIDVGDQVLVGTELVNSVPIASLRLGPSTGWMLDWCKSVYNSSNSKKRKVMSDAGDPVFVRIKVPKELAGNLQGGNSASAVPSSDDGQTGEKLVVLDLDRARASSSQTALTKPPRRNVVRSKKRTIDDMLSSFT